MSMFTCFLRSQILFSNETFLLSKSSSAYLSQFLLCSLPNTTKPKGQIAAYYQTSAVQIITDKRLNADINIQHDNFATSQVTIITKPSMHTTQLHWCRCIINWFQFCVCNKHHLINFLKQLTHVLISSYCPTLDLGPYVAPHATLSECSE